MPEGPEVRKYALALDAVLSGRAVTSLDARTRDAKAWLKENEKRIIGRRVLKVTSHGKHLLGYIQGGFYFHSHLMMWGRWQTFPGPISNARPSQPGSPDTGKLNGRERAPTATGVLADNGVPIEKDRRERARVLVEGGAAILFSAPIFDVGEGDPYEQLGNLSTLGPDVLPAKGKFDAGEFRRRLLLPEHLGITVGAALLNQRILAGLGNYLRAEVLFNCKLNPWREVRDLTEKNLQCLSRTAPELALRSLISSATATELDRERMRADSSLVYQEGREYGTRHLVFRRTNLPCLQCDGPIKQLRQPTYNGDLTSEEDSDGPERTRIVYFCPTCQHVET